jgi:outer membrane lipoprotein carrier protein
LDEDEKSTGKLYLKVPGQIRWEYDPPHAKVLLVKDDKIVVYNPVAQQAQEFKKGQMPGAGADLLIGFGKSNAEIGKHYDVNLLEEDANQAVLELIPKPGSTASVFAAIELTINKKTWTPDRTVFHEMNRDTTLLIFQEVRVNGSLPARIFELDLPPNVDVIRGE